ncbi:transposase [Mycolicibacterium agri]|uniref:transposase n=1 Tax=Mycolicibacterium agri TaxID=36811 RepID=UPI0023542D3B|nr:transposase [Mycolicibacterium agri]
MIIDLDATLITAHSDKEQAAPTFKYGYGFHPMLAFVDHGADGSGEALAGCCAGLGGLQQRCRPHQRPGCRAGPAARP